MPKEEIQNYVGSENLKVTSNSNKLVIVHYGTDGMKWGRRKYQYEDGSLTPLGRIHYGVGEARAKAKIKMREQKNAAKLERKRIKAEGKAAAELERARIKAEGEAKRDIEKARTEAEIAKQREEFKAMRESNKAEIEAEKAYGKEVTKQKKLELESERQFQKDNINAAKEQAVQQDKNDHSKAKVILGIAAAAGIGYLLYRACRSGSVTKHAGAGRGVINANATRPVSELLAVNSKSVAEATTSKAKKARVGLATRFKNWQAKQLAARDKISLEEAIERLKHSDDSTNGMVLIHSEDIYHHGIKGQRWGLRRWQYEDGSLTPEGRIRYGRSAEKKARKSQGYETISNTTLASRPWRTAAAGTRGAAAGAMLAAVTGGEGVDLAVGALIGGPVGALATFGGTTLAVFLAKKLSQRNERIANELIEKTNNKKVQELEKEMTPKEKEALEYATFLGSKEAKKAEDLALQDAIKTFKQKEGTERFEAMLKEVNGNESELWRFPVFDTILDGCKNDRWDEAYKDWKKAS